MNAYVLEHAKDNVWCEPLQDKDYVIQPARLTPSGGTIIPFTIGWNTYPLPSGGSRRFYHLYQIGRLPTHLFGLEYLDHQWTSIDAILAKTDTLVDVYLDNGVVVDRRNCYLQKSPWDSNFILAVAIDNSYDYGTKVTYNDVTTERIEEPATLNNQNLHIRFYTNARTDSQAGRVIAERPNDQVRVSTIDTLQLSELKTYVKRLTDKSNKVAWILSRGRIINLARLENNPTTYLGHHISTIIDETVLLKQYFVLKDTPTFISERNLNKTKYILKLSVDPRSLVYYNDVEYFLGLYEAGQFKGIRIPLRRDDSVVQLTNIIHAMRVDVIEDLLHQHSWLDQSDQLTIMAVIRQGGMVRGLTHQNSRIEELMTMSAENLNAALTGLNAVMPEWSAVRLEKDDYAKLISAPIGEITLDLIYRAYGYNAITIAHQPNPVLVSPYPQVGAGWYKCQLGNALSYKPELVINAQPIELIVYGTDGKFVERRREHFNNQGLQGIHSTTPVGLVESYLNRYERSELVLTEYYDLVVANNDLAAYGFAAYVSPKVNGKASGVWTEVTGSDYYTYSSIDGVATFRWVENKLNSLNVVGMIRINNEVCYREFNASQLRGNDREFLSYRFANNSDGNPTVEPGSIDVWLDEYLLIEDIDYYVKWPMLYIVKVPKNYDCKCRIRLSGLAIDAKHDKPREVGFAVNGILSYNGRYDIRNDRNIQINVAGQLKHRSQVSFTEDATTLRVVDGSPYQIKDYTTSIESYTNHNTVVAKREAEALDTRVMNYLSLYNVEKNPGRGIVKDQRWQVVSPFLNAAMTRLKNGWLSSELTSGYDMGNVATWVADLAYLLEFDPAVRSDSNLDYVRVLPHPHHDLVTVSLAQYKFLALLVKNYLNDNIDLNITVGIVN